MMKRQAASSFCLARKLCIGLSKRPASNIGARGLFEWPKFNFAPLAARFLDLKTVGKDSNRRSYHSLLRPSLGVAESVTSCNFSEHVHPVSPSSRTSFIFKNSFTRHNICGLLSNRAFSTDRKPDACKEHTGDGIGDAQKSQNLTGVRNVWDDAMTIPNMLSIGRLIATPFICHWMYIGDYKLAIVAFWIAGFCDWVDGYIARKWKQQTILGSFLDPLADKVFVSSTLLVLTAKGLIPLPLFGLVMARDLGLVLGSFYMRYLTKPANAAFFDMGKMAGVVSVEASQISKFNALFQFGLVWFSMTSVEFGIPPPELLPVAHTIVYCSTLASGFDYWYRGNWKTIFVQRKTQND